MATQEQRMEVYLSLPEVLKKVYSSEEAASLNRQLMEKYAIGEDFADDFLDITGDVILGFNKITDLPRLFQQKLTLSADDSQRLTSELIDFLSPVVEREQQEALAKKASLAALSNTFAKPAMAPVQKGEEMPVDLENVAPLRTMQGDINRIHGYGAYNEAQEKEALKQENEPFVTSSQDHIFSGKNKDS